MNKRNDVNYFLSNGVAKNPFFTEISAQVIRWR